MKIIESQLIILEIMILFLITNENDENHENNEIQLENHYN